MVTRGEGWKKGIVKEFEINMYTLLYLKWTTNKDLLQSTGPLNFMWQPGWKGGLEENGYTYVYMVERFCCPPETITKLSINWLYSNIK